MVDAQVAGTGAGLPIKEIEYLLLLLLLITVAYRLTSAKNEFVFDTLSYRVIGYPECKELFCFAPSQKEIDDAFMNIDSLRASLELISNPNAVVSSTFTTSIFGLDAGLASAVEALKGTSQYGIIGDAMRVMGAILIFMIQLIVTGLSGIIIAIRLGIVIIPTLAAIKFLYESWYGPWEQRTMMARHW